jgi:hypothetical protein
MAYRLVIGGSAHLWMWDEGSIVEELRKCERSHTDSRRQRALTKQCAFATLGAHNAASFASF